MRHGSLFSGIGGFDLAAQWMGWQNIFHCEWNPFGQRVLKHYWPKAITYHDITQTDFTIHRGTIDVLTGGFPCQPYSMAGKRLGKDDERHLWPEMLRAIREIRPRWIVGENVFGLVNWSGGLVFHEVQTDLEAAGYEVFPYVLPACAVNAPHRRDRIWFVAYNSSTRLERSARERIQGRSDGYTNVSNEWYAPHPNGNGQQRSDCQHEVNASKRGEYAQRNVEQGNDDGAAADSDGIRGGQNERFRNGESNVIDKNGQATDWQTFPSVSPICHGDDGLSDRLDSITFPKWRNESIKAGGNAIVPQVALQIFKTIAEYERVK